MDKPSATALIHRITHTADGCAALTLHFSDQDTKYAFSNFSTKHAEVALVLLDDGLCEPTTLETKHPNPTDNRWGGLAQKLMQSRFFEIKQVWEAFGINHNHEDPFNFAKNKLKKSIGYDHLYDIPPKEMTKFCESLNIAQFLPKCYYD